MPYAPKTFCGLNQPTPKQNAKQYDKARGNAAERGYDSQWRKLRDWLMKQPEFVMCACGCGRPARCIDHIDGFNGLDDPLRFDLRNLQPLTISENTAKAKTPPTNAALQRMRDTAVERAEAIERRMVGL